MDDQSPPQPAEKLQAVEVSYEHSQGLPALLEQLELSVLLSTYQASRVVSVGSHRGELRLGFSHFDQAMGLCRTASGIAVGTRDGIWSLPTSREIAPNIKPEGQHDMAFLAWCSERLWLVNTLFNGLVTIEGDWSFVPQWQPPFISGWDAGDRCHLNGLAMAEDGSAPAYVTALGETDTENGWREHKATSGCLIHVPSGEVVLRGLSMPHSPRLYQGQLYLLCGLVIVDLALSAVRELLWFHSGLEEVFAISVVLTVLDQEVNQTDIDSEPLQPTCLGPPVAKG